MYVAKEKKSIPNVVRNLISSHIVFKEDNKYYNISNVQNNLDFVEKRLFNFKGNTVYSSLYDNGKETTIDYNKTCLNPTLIYETTRELSKRINDYFISKESKSDE